MCDPSELKKLPNPPRVVPPPADGVDGFVVVEAEPPESDEPKNDRELWYPPDPPDPLLRHAREAGSSGAPPSTRWHVSLGIIE
jgi:hypothetical protein